MLRTPPFQLFRVATCPRLAVASLQISRRSSLYHACISTSAVLNAESHRPGSSPALPDAEYHGPLTQTFRRLKIFSLSSLGLSCTLAPFMFLVESSLPFSARCALASIAIGTSGISTHMVGWCGRPYVHSLKRLRQEENGNAEGLELETSTLFLHPRITRVYDPAFLIETRRPFAKWELAEKLVLPENKPTTPGSEETVAETTDKDGNVLGRWVVKWQDSREGVCHESGEVIRYFNVHEELLS